MYEHRNYYAIKTTPSSKTFPRQAWIDKGSPLVSSLVTGEHTGLSALGGKLAKVMEKRSGMEHDYMVYVLSDSKHNIWTPTGVHSKGAIVGDWV